MKCTILISLVALAAAGSPVEQVVTLITGIKETVTSDGESELRAYDKYSCWCEDTLAMKSSDITKGKEDIVSLQTLITKLGAELASLDVEIKQVKKDLAENLESQKETKAIRDKEQKAYIEERSEAEQCIGALEAAIKILTGAGEVKEGKTFLFTREAQLMGTVGSLRGVLGTSLVRMHVAKKDLDMVREFINSPDEFFKKPSMSALQAGANPFGDYAPQSGQIQGILKGMYDTFTGKLEGANVEESKKVSAYEELMETKVKEEKALAKTVQMSETAEADKTSEHADSKSNLDHTKEQLEADEIFFADTKSACKSKAMAWSERTRLRAEELQGMNTAIAILSSSTATKTFDSASTTFLQIAATPADSAYKKLHALQTKFGGAALAQVAAEAKAGGHFDKVIAMIDGLIRKLGYEGEEDVKQKERCESEQDTNKKNMEDLNFDLTKTTEKLERLADQKKELQAKGLAHQKEVADADKTITEMKEQREKEWGDASQATKDDLKAIELLGQAIQSLTKFYKDNKIGTTNLLQGTPEASPTTWEDDNYGGKKSETGGVVAILEMIKEDLEKEVKLTTQGDEAANVNFQNDLKAAQSSRDRQAKLKADADQELADVLSNTDYRKEDETTHKTDLAGEEKIKTALETECAWVETHFEKRKTSRKLEIEGLEEAKHFLQGAVALPR